MYHAQQKAYGNRVRRMTPDWFDVWTRVIRVRSITPELYKAAVDALSDKGFEDAVVRAAEIILPREQVPGGPVLRPKRRIILNCGPFAA